MVEPFKLPPLRQELGIFPGPAYPDGSPSWTLHDPAANRFYQISWPAFEILSRWELGSSEAISESIGRETTLSVTDDDIRGMISFLDRNFLIDSAYGGTGRIAARFEALRGNWPSWLLKNYLFFRIPLFRPQRFLDAAARRLSWVYTRWFAGIVIAVALAGLYVISRQWDIFKHSFTAYQNWEGILALAVTVSLAKTAHEFGHAITASRYGCRIPVMGIAFVVLFPMLYTDTNEVWKLKEARQRIAVVVAGMAAEILFAIAAIWAWILLPDGPAKAGAFILGTSTWILALTINASPFLRFDGYFLLSDMMGIPNLHPRSFAFGRWWLREILFGFGDPPPEPVRAKRRIFLIVFSFAVWLYRFIIFLGIALLVYRYFFKALGIILFAVEIWWFILLPIYEEVTAWWKLRHSYRLNAALLRTAVLISIATFILIVPWRGRVIAPAVLSAAREQQIYSSLPSVVLSEPTRGRQNVRTGEALIVLDSRDLQHRIEKVRISESVYRWQAEQQPFDERMLAEGAVIRSRHEESKTELVGKLEEKERLTTHAAFDGLILSRNDELQPGLMLPAKEQLYIIVDIRKSRVDAYVSGPDLERISVGNKARFIPDALEFGTADCLVEEIDPVNVSFLDEPSLASTYHGPIASHADSKGNLQPVSPVCRVRLSMCNPGNVPMLRLTGKVGIEAKRRNVMIDALRSAYATLIRESGF
jgi:putative peptide zinc metalloprotease protein